MFDRLLSLPHASWKARALALLMTSMEVLIAWQQWPHRHDDLAIARWIAWFFLVSVPLLLPSLLVVCVFGRLPKTWQHFPGRLGKTLPQIHAGIAREQQEQRERSIKP